MPAKTNNIIPNINNENMNISTPSQSLTLTDGNLRRGLAEGLDFSQWKKIIIIAKESNAAALKIIISTFGANAEVTPLGNNPIHEGAIDYAAKFQPRQ